MLAIAVGPPELLILLIIVLVLFGGAKLPKLARSLGQAQREFREGVNEADRAEMAAKPDSAEKPDKPETSS